METAFTLNIDGEHFDLVSMNITGPKLFQVFSTLTGTRERFHLHAVDGGRLEFALREQCPPHLLAYEGKISDAILQKYNGRS